ncbi:MAG: magnesium transporter [Candidatus Hodarchaeaceae archaeon]|nr:magnesium transporter [Candidatus Hodarchaeaceae archaeon]
MAREVDVRSVVVQGLSILLLCALIELGAGGVFTGMQEGFTAFLPGLIVMVPPLLDLRGNINGALASRLGTGLNAGLIRPRLRLSAEIRVNLASSLILSVIASATIGIFSFVVNLLTGPPTINAIQLLIQLIAIAVIAGFTSGLILASLTVVMAIFTFKHGWDPDNVTAPAMTSIGDFVTIACIYLAVLLVI